MKSWTRMTAQMARKTYQMEKEIFLFTIHLSCDAEPSYLRTH